MFQCGDGVHLRAVGDEVEVVAAKGSRRTVVTGITRSGAAQDQGQAGDDVDVQLRGVGEDDVAVGQVLAAPGAVTPRVKFTADVYGMKGEEGGRREPFADRYRPRLAIRAADVTGTAKLPDGVMTVMPGDNITMTLTLDEAVPLEERLRFALFADEDDEERRRCAGGGRRRDEDPGLTRSQHRQGGATPATPASRCRSRACSTGSPAVNSSFYRPHRPSTYAKWAAAVPEAFRFAVKVPKELTHVRRLGEVGEVEPTLDRFLAEVTALGPRLGPLLVQLPPSLAFTPAVARRFFTALRQRVSGDVVCEPRHASWFTAPAQSLLEAFRVARVAADPALAPAAAGPGGWDGLVYYRLHGSPTIYRSPYPPTYLDALARTLARHLGAGTHTWCTFDNTAEGAAAADALALLARLGARRSAARHGAPSSPVEMR